LYVTEHIALRYCQRVIGIQSAPECKEYIEQNRPEIEQHILVMFKKATWIYCGKIGEGNPKSNYYVYENYLLVADKENENAVTLALIKYPFPRATIIKVVKDLTREIKRKQAKYEKVAAVTDKQMAKEKAKFDALDQQANELRKQLQAIDQAKKESRHAMVQIRAKPEALEEEIRELAFQICYGSYYTGHQRKSG